MDTGVSTKTAMAGIAMGLISDGKRTAILSDISGTEDHLGDMNFKVNGSKDGITGFQMDIKIAGLSQIVLEVFQLVRLERVFDIYPSEEEAIRDT